MHAGSLGGKLKHTSKAEMREFWLRIDNRRDGSKERRKEESYLITKQEGLWVPRSTH